MNDIYGILHCHTDHSVKDCPIKIEDLCKKAKDLGVKAIAITDHGTCTGWIAFKECCEKYEIQPVLGVEAYIKTAYAPYAHLILMAKNYQGYQEISHAITEANNNLVNIGNIMSPVMDWSILTKYFGHGNVIATTACVSGIIAQVFHHNTRIDHQIEKLKVKYKELGCTDIQANTADLQALEREIAFLAARKEEVSVLAKKTYKKRIRGIESLRVTSPETYQDAKEQLDKEIEESKRAQTELEIIKKELAAKRSKRTVLNRQNKTMEKTLGKALILEQKINALTKERIPDDQVVAAAEQELVTLYHVFGEDLYCEMQYHGLDDEKAIMPILATLAAKHKIPLVAANDVHILDQQQAFARQSLNALRFSKWEPVTESDKELYPKTDHQLREALSIILKSEQVEESIANIQKVFEKCVLAFPTEDHYPQYIDTENRMNRSAESLLREKTYQRVPIRYPGGLSEENQNRLAYELDTICELGYADYFLIVADFIEYAKKLACENPYQVGYGVGPGRGSAVGSMVTYLLGITEIDPLKYGLIFERFLNKDRVSMPDIDTDFSDEVREKTIAYVTDKYSPAEKRDPSDQYVSCIRTLITQGARASIRNEARNYGFEKYPITDDMSTAEKREAKENRRSLVSMGDRICKDIPAIPQISFSDSMGDTTLLQALLQNYRLSDEQTIIRRAAMVEKTNTGNSIHAAGVIISDGNPIQNYIPLLYNAEKEQWAVQCDMNEAERLHLLKMDFLGLNTLDIISETMRRIKKNWGISIPISELPFEQEVFHNIFCKGKTTCVFQFESSGMKQMLKEFRPESIEDLILLVAAYRPGPMEFIPEIIDVKKGRKQPHYIVKELERILNPTYGKPIYQEQLMDIFHSCAGFSLGEADIIRRYMSKKKVSKFLAYKDQFIDGLMENGCLAKDALELWESLEDFSKYAFNKSHAAAYAILAYQTAWLKYHYPTEFMCSFLNHTDVKEIPSKLYECKELGISILPPDINRSNVNFEDYQNSILFGLGAVKGIKKWAKPIIEERSQHGKYQSFQDFLLRAHKNKGATGKLVQAGAFDHFCKDHRSALLEQMEPLVLYRKRIKEKESLLQELDQKLEKATQDEQSELRKQIQKTKQLLEQTKAAFEELQMSNKVDNKLESLALEKEILGNYISGHPLNAYAKVLEAEGITHICDCHSGFGTFAGLITNLAIRHRKADRKKMAFFTLEDLTGTIAVNCFTSEYQKYGTYIEEGNVIKISGYINEEVSPGEDEVTKTLVVRSLSYCKPDLDPIFLSVRNLIEEWGALEDKLIPFREEQGYPVILHDQATGHMYPLKFCIRKDILKSKEFSGYFLQQVTR